jgi:hypothetical protein
MKTPGTILRTFLLLSNECQKLRHVIGALEIYNHPSEYKHATPAMIANTAPIDSTRT